MIQTLKNILHSLFVESGFIFYYIYPILERIILYFPIIKPNHAIVDEGGSKILVTKYKGKIFHPVPVEKLENMKQFYVRNSDVLLSGYPKTGCHWVYEIIYMIQNNTTSLSRYGKAFGGFIDIAPDALLAGVPSPRVLNSHFLYEDLPAGIREKKTKIVLTVRNAKDTAVSFYHHNKNLVKVYGGYDGKFENYFKLFMSQKLEYGCFFEYYKNWAKVIASNSDNEIYLLDYNDLKKDPVTMIKRVAKFLGKEISHEFAVAVSNTSCFSNMKKVRSKDPNHGNILFRKGIVGDWKNWMTDRMREEMDRKWKVVEAECQAIKDRQNGRVQMKLSLTQHTLK